MITCLRIFAHRILVFVASAVLLTGIVTGYRADRPAAAPPAYAAACQSAHQDSCGVEFRTAAVAVTHGVQDGINITPVEPDTGEDWQITAYWNTAEVPCLEMYEVATATASWTGTSWELSDINLTTHITDIDICNEQTCEKEDLHGYGYKLIAKVMDPVSGHNIRAVKFETMYVDDGSELDTESCTLGTGVSPTSQTFTATDTPAFECGYDCTHAGTSLLIRYE